MRRRRALEIGTMLAGIAFVGVIASLRASQSEAPISTPSTFDSGPRGYAALYDLLRGEGVRVSRFDRPADALAHPPGTLVIAGDDAVAQAASSSTARTLDSWVRAGGRLVVLASRVPLSRTLGVEPGRDAPAFDIATPKCAAPSALQRARVAGNYLQRESERCSGRRRTLLATPYGAIAAAQPRGRGVVVQIRTASLFDNAHLSLEQNARVGYALFSAYGPIAFDEFLHGYAADRSFWSVVPSPMRAAIVLSCAAVLLAIVGFNLPPAPKRSLEEAPDRDTSAYISSVARMLQRGGAGAQVVRRLAHALEAQLALHAVRNARASALLKEMQTLAAHPNPRSAQVLRAGLLFAQARKEYGR